MEQRKRSRSALVRDLGAAFGGASPTLGLGLIFAASTLTAHASFENERVDSSFWVSLQRVLHTFIERLDSALGYPAFAHFSGLTLIWIVGAYAFADVVVILCRVVGWFESVDAHRSAIWEVCFGSWLARLTSIVFGIAAWPLLLWVLFVRPLLVEELDDDRTDDDDGVDLGVFAAKGSEKGSAMPNAYLCDLRVVAGARFAVDSLAILAAVWLSWFIAGLMARG